MLVLEENNLCRLLPLRLTLVLDDFIVLGQLDLVSLDHLCNFGFLRLLEARKHLD